LQRHFNPGCVGGGRGIRTPGTLSGTAVFKTAGINRSPIPPTPIVPGSCVFWAGEDGSLRTSGGAAERERATNLVGFAFTLAERESTAFTARVPCRMLQREYMVARKKPGTQPLPGQPISLRTLGEYLNLSPATISLVLNNAPGVRSIPQETRDRVTEAAAKFDYRPSFFARSLRKKKTFTIGVLVPELSDNYTTQVLAGVEEFLIEEGYFYLTASHRRKPDLIEEYPRLLMDRSVEGFILIDTVLEKSIPLPVVVVAGHRKIEGVTNVVLDQRRAAELALRHLYQLGHRKIAFMRGGSHSSDADDRWRCLMAEVRELKLVAPPEMTVQLFHRSATPELGFGPANELLNRGIDFTALVCYNDVSAIGAIRAMMDRGLRVPTDISVVGFDDIQGAAFHNPSLTTIRQPLAQMGVVAARILLQRIRGQATFPNMVPIMPELVIRESTAPPSHRGSRQKRSGGYERT
jgi:DNA-binding LacI/PurR family transcriptional regulator